MSSRNPIIAVTGSSGAGTSTTTESFEHIFRSLGITSATVEGDSFHRYSRQEMDLEKRKAKEQQLKLSYFGAAANDFDALEELFKDYSETGKGKIRRYLHTFDEAVPYNQMPGTFTPWETLGEGTDLLYYEGLHGGVVTENNDVAKHVDLLIGMVPIVNLEWIQKIIRDTDKRGHSREAVTQSIVRSMEDYISFITPQFSRTHINFQRVPTVDTSNPFSAKAIPTLDESFVVIRCRESSQLDFPYYLSMIDGSFMSRMNTLVVPGGKMGLAMELLLTPLIKDLMLKKSEANKQLDWMSDL
ncbi:phosphoribulokinase [Colwellia sp. MB02u-10]|jgi:phosphoribulokinase|uniref:phosphoribulokinase n=1 Tax=Colwellia sp. MB02u-10 TaxID=2759828 RepID=UPI0015F6FE18|nr:phosphoribulokinase [Colwellia sp. MB02u-10]MBA6340612.1 phosphoribulokinase [Colwellia sp. MB02u-10]